MENRLKLLLLEDDPADAALIQKLLERAGMQFSADVVSDETEFLQALKNHNFDAVLADNALPQYSSIEALKTITEKDPYTAFILVTGTVSEEFAVSIIQQGADDYILKTNLTRLPSAINNAIQKKNIQREKDMAEANIEKERELSASIINSLPGIFFFCDSNENFIRWNKNFEKITGYSGEEIMDMRPEYFFTLNYREIIQQFIIKNLKHGHAETEAELLTRNNTKIPYCLTGMAVNFENKECVICVGLDVSASKQSEEKLLQLNEELRSVSGHLEKIREEERARIAREIHDQLGQQLTGLKMDLSWVKNKMSKQTEASGVGGKIDEMFIMVDDAVVTVRKIASDLRPSVLDDFGFTEALDWYSKEFAKRSGIKVEFTQPKDEIQSESDVAIGLFRIYQELLTNVARHAAATKVHSSVSIENDKIILSVKDNGKGFNTAEVKKKKTLGLLGIKERILTMDGMLEIDSTPGKGTRISIKVPLKQVEN